MTRRRPFLYACLVFIACPAGAGAAALVEAVAPQSGIRAYVIGEINARLPAFDSLLSPGALAPAPIAAYAAALSAAPTPAPMAAPEAAARFPPAAAALGDAAFRQVVLAVVSDPRQSAAWARKLEREGAAPAERQAGELLARVAAKVAGLDDGQRLRLREAFDPLRVSLKDAAVAPSKLSAIFDGARFPAPEPSAPVSGGLRKTPLAETALRRAADRRIPLSEVGLTISESPNAKAAARRLEDLGLVLPGEVGAATPQERRELALLLHELWYEAAPQTPAQFQEDRSGRIPAAVASFGELTVYAHGVDHGVLGRDRGWVRAFVADLRRAGAALYSEQHLPSAMSYSYGRELLDHQAADSPADSLPASAFPRLGRGAAAVLLLPVSWLGDSVLKAFFALVEGAVRPFMPKMARLIAVEDGGGLMEKYAELVSFKRIDAAAARRLSLPYPLALDARSDLTPLSISDSAYTNSYRRSEAMAAAAVAGASVAGLREVHLLVGYAHVEQIVWAVTQRTDGFMWRISAGVDRLQEPR